MGNPWLELELSAGEEAAPYLETALTDAAFEGWVVEQESPRLQWVLYLPQEGDWPGRLEQLQRIAADHQAVLAQRGEVRDEDWAENWKAFYHPKRVGERLVICPSWEKFEPRPEDVVVILDPGSAFGTGYHETTRLCLLALQEAKPGTVLDCGTGSGILAIAAALLGADSVQAFDRDPVAVKVARENVEINHVRVEVREAAEPPEGVFDTVVANITAAALIGLRDRLLAATGGRLILSGIIEERAEEVVEAFTGHGLELVQRHHEGEWVALVWAR